MIPAQFRRLVRDRAAGRCEYCRVHQDDDPYGVFHVEHIRARQHGGTDHSDNLAWACHVCNLFKGPNLSGVDPVSGQVVLLYHPRRQVWARHFRPVGAQILGVTRSGRATVAVLNLNQAARVAARTPLAAVKRWPG